MTDLTEGGVTLKGAYRIDIKVPLRARLIQIDEDLIDRNLQLGEDEVHALTPWAVGVGVKGDLGRDAWSLVASHCCNV